MECPFKEVHHVAFINVAIERRLVCADTLVCTLFTQNTFWTLPELILQFGIHPKRLEAVIPINYNSQSCQALPAAATLNEGSGEEDGI